MRKFILSFILVFLTVLAGCTSAAEPVLTATVPPDDGTSFTLINEVEETDIWIIPDTEENRKTTLWGTATVASLPSGYEASVPLAPLGGPGNYLFRAIDKNEIYYEANDFRIENGYVLRFVTDEDVPLGAFLEIRDEHGRLIDTVSVFAASL